MIIIKRFSPYWSSLGILILLIVGVNQPLQWLPISVGLVMVIVATIVLMHQPHWHLEYIGLSTALLILILSCFTFILILEQNTIIYGLIAVTTAIYFLFVQNIVLFLFVPKKYIPYSLEYICTYSNVVASFYMYVSAFIFLALGLGRVRYVLTLACCTTLILVWQTFWIQKIAWSQARWCIVVISLIMAETIWAMHYWPISFFVSGFLLTIELYVLLNMSRYYLHQTLTSKLVVLYLTTSGIAILILLLTAQWLL